MCLNFFDRQKFLKLGNFRPPKSTPENESNFGKSRDLEKQPGYEVVKLTNFTKKLCPVCLDIYTLENIFITHLAPLLAPKFQK